MKKEKNIIILHEYLMRNVHQVKILVYGAGGTGSHLVTHLARIHYTLVKLGKHGLDVSVIDSDLSGETTPCRAALNPWSEGLSKAVALVSGINSAYGTTWQAFPHGYVCNSEADFIILCTDTVRSRREIISRYLPPSHPGYKYYIDCGNTSSTGQIILGTSRHLWEMNQKKSKQHYHVKDFFDFFPDVQDTDITPSCSVYDSVSRQGLFVNSLIANLCGQLIYELLVEHAMDYQGFYMNMDNGWSKIPVEYSLSKRIK